VGRRGPAGDVLPGQPGRHDVEVHVKDVRRRAVVDAGLLTLGCWRSFAPPRATASSTWPSATGTAGRPAWGRRGRRARSWPSPPVGRPRRGADRGRPPAAVASSCAPTPSSPAGRHQPVHPSGLATRGDRRRRNLPGPRRRVQPSRQPGGGAIARGALLALRAHLPVGADAELAGGQPGRLDPGSPHRGDDLLQRTAAGIEGLPRGGAPRLDAKVQQGRVGDRAGHPSPTTLTRCWSAVGGAAGSGMTPPRSIGYPTITRAGREVKPFRRSATAWARQSRFVLNRRQQRCAFAIRTR
jgi:hypothetical protein